MVPAIVCPVCKKDTPAKDFSRIVRYYAREEGIETCHECGARLAWAVTVEKVDNSATVA